MILIGNILCITEKPSVAKDIANVIGATTRNNGYFSGNGYNVTWAVGHLIGLAEPEQYGYMSQKEIWNKEESQNRERALSELPLIPKDFKTIVLPNTKEQFEIVKKLMLSNETDYIIDCGDMGAEGHILQWLIREKVGTQKLVKRFCATSMTNEAIKKSMNNLRDIEDFEKIIVGEFCKKKADWILGMSMSRCASIKYNTKIDVGRVQSPTLFFIVKRYIDVNKFVVSNYYELEAFFEEGFKLNWKRDNTNSLEPTKKNDEGRIINKDIADRLAYEIKNSNDNGKITKLETKLLSSNRPQLYDITELQRNGNIIYNYTASEVLETAQSLYEKHKITTYPRTDSRYITSDLVPYMEERVKEISFIEKYNKIALSLVSKGLNIDKIIVDDSKVTDHHAIIVNENIKGYDLGKLSEKEINILNLIITRMLVAFSEIHTFNETVLQVTINDIIFEAKGKIIVNNGWKYTQKFLSKNIEDNEEEEEQVFPNLYQGQEVRLHNINVLSKKTTPPKLHTEATLLTAMENAGSQIENGAILKGKGIGTQATRADIIKRLFDKDYVTTEKKGKKNYIIPTKQGLGIIQALPKELYSPKITADWETKISKIISGDITEKNFMEDFEEFIKTEIKKVIDSENDSVDFSREKEVIGSCPYCKSDIYYGEFKNKDTKEKFENFYCSNKSCKFKISKSKNAYFNVTKKKLTTTQFKKLITIGVIYADCVSKAGKDYKAQFTLEKNENGYPQLKFEFAKDNKQKKG